MSHIPNAAMPHAQHHDDAAAAPAATETTGQAAPAEAAAAPSPVATVKPSDSREPKPFPIGWLALGLGALATGGVALALSRRGDRRKPARRAPAGKRKKPVHKRKTANA